MKTQAETYRNNATTLDHRFVIMFRYHSGKPSIQHEHQKHRPMTMLKAKDVLCHQMNEIKLLNYNCALWCGEFTSLDIVFFMGRKGTFLKKKNSSSRPKELT